MSSLPGLVPAPPELNAEWATFETYRAQDPVYSSAARTKELETGHMKIHPWETCNAKHLPHILLRVEGMQRVLPRRMPRQSRVASVSGFMYTHPDLECLHAKLAHWPTILAFRLDGNTLVPTPCLYCGSRVLNGVCAVPQKEVKVAAGAVDADRLKQLVIIDLPGTVGFGVGSRASGTSDNDALPGPSSTATRSTTSAATGDSGGATSSTASGNRPPKRPIKIKLRPPPAAATSDGNASSDKSRKRRRTVADVSERIEELESQAARLSQQQTEYAPLKNTVGAQAVVSVNLTRRVTALVTERKEDLESRIPTMIKDALAEERARHESELARVEARLEEKHAAARAAEIKELGARLKAEYDAELEAIKTKVKEVIDIRMEHERGVWATAIDTWKQHERGLWATAIDTSIEDVVERCNDRGETERKRLEARLVAARAEELEDLEARVKASVAAERRSVVADRTAENAAKVQEMEHGLKDVKAEMARLRGQNTKHLEQRAEELRVWQDSFTQSRTADNFAIKRNVKDIIVFCGELRDTVTRLVDDVQGLRAQIGSGSGGSGAIAAALTPSDSSEEEEEEEGIIAALTMLQHHGAEH